jgi:hypothetical protein
MRSIIRSIISCMAVALLLLAVMPTQRAAADNRAQELIKQARAALGGEEALNGVHSLSMIGDLRRADRSGDIRLDLMLPDKFKRAETMTLIANIEATFTSALNGDQVWNSSTTNGGDGNVRMNSRSVRPNDDAHGQTARGQQLRMEFARHLIGLLLTSPATFPLDYVYAGEGESKDGRADVIDIKGPEGFAARLFLDKTSHRPLLMRYRGVITTTTINTSVSQAGSREEMEKILKDAKEGKGAGRSAARQEGVQEIYFSDYRQVNGLLLPHHISRTANGKLSEEWTIKKYKINPPLTARDFEKK